MRCLDLSYIADQELCGTCPCSYHPGSPHDMQLDWAMITRSRQWAQASAQQKAALAENHTAPGFMSAWDKG